MARRYSKKASESVESAMRRRKKGALRSGSGRKVRSRTQAIAIGLSDAREKGAKVPPPESGTGARKAGGTRKRKTRGAHKGGKGGGRK